MKIIDVKIDWMDQYANDPQIKILVDRMPELDELTYQKKHVGNHDLYFAEKDGYVHFLAHDKSHEDGFGGSAFTLHLEDEETVHIKGPWSSRCSAMNKIFEPHSTEVSVTDDPKAFERGFTFTAGYVTVDLLNEALKRTYGLQLTRELKYDEGEISYHIKKEDKREPLG